MSKLQWKSIRIGPEKNFCYLVFDPITRETAVFDGAFDFEKVQAEISSSKLQVKYLVATHGHWDHAGGLKNMRTVFPKAQIAVGYEDRELVKKQGAEIDVLLKDKSVLQLGDTVIKVLHTPGHTEGGCCFYFDGFLISGDTLFIDQCGRTDLPGGSDQKLFESLQKLKDFPDDTIVLPGHDYGPKPTDKMANQKKTNLTLVVTTLKDFVELS